jgi:hypothetical protein
MNPNDRRKYPMKMWLATVITGTGAPLEVRRERRAYMVLANCEADARRELWNTLSVAQIYGWRLVSLVECAEPVYHLSTGIEG